jgi:hypothetical protein
MTRIWTLPAALALLWSACAPPLVSTGRTLAAARILDGQALFRVDGARLRCSMRVALTPDSSTAACVDELGVTVALVTESVSGIAVRRRFPPLGRRNAESLGIASAMLRLQRASRATAGAPPVQASVGRFRFALHAHDSLLDSAHVRRGPRDRYAVHLRPGSVILLDRANDTALVCSVPPATAPGP